MIDDDFARTREQLWLVAKAVHGLDVLACLGRCEELQHRGELFGDLDSNDLRRLRVLGYAALSFQNVIRQLAQE